MVEKAPALRSHKTTLPASAGGGGAESVAKPGKLPSMIEAMLTKELRDLSRPEKLLLINDLWEDIAASAEDLEISPELAEKLDQRYAAFLRDPGEGVTWKEFNSRLCTG